MYIVEIHTVCYELIIHEKSVDVQQVILITRLLRYTVLFL